MSALTIALTKGRILKETLPLLASVGIHTLDNIHNSRKLIFATQYNHTLLHSATTHNYYTLLLHT